VAEIVDRHRGQRARDPFADRDQHVELARLRVGSDLPREVEQLVRRRAHRRKDRDHAGPALASGSKPTRDVLQLLRIGDRGAAELHHDRAEVTPRVVALDGRNGLVVGRRHG
jgi:hypothetical protein